MNSVINLFVVALSVLAFTNTMVVMVSTAVTTNITPATTDIIILAVL